MKKLVSLILVAALTAGMFVFASEKEPIDEDFRVEVNVSDFVFAGLATAGNTTDLGVDFTWNNNRLGFRVGAMVRESFFRDTTAMDFSWNPYIGFTFFNGCVMAGAVPRGSADDFGFMPYFGFNWDFDLTPVKNGFSNNFAIRVGTDVYIDIFDEDAFTAIFGVLMSVMPRVYVGVTYKIGWGQKNSNYVSSPAQDDSYDYGNSYGDSEEKYEANDDDDYDSLF